MDHFKHPELQDFISIPTKICDGVFMSDSNIAKDLDWIATNQVTHIINCAGKHIQNHKLAQVSFLTFDWSESVIQNILDQNVIGTSVSFIQQAKKQGGTILLHYFQSQSRPFCLLAAYFMIKFQWNLFKTLQFLNSRKQDIQLQPAFFQQLTALHQKLHDKGLIKSRNWGPFDKISDEELIITNTFLNSRKKSTQIQAAALNKSRAKSKQAKQTKQGNISWKTQIFVQHTYNPSSAIASVHDKKSASQGRNNSKERERPQSLKKQQNNQNKQVNQLSSKSSTEKQIVSDMSVTKKWNQLKQAWSKQKQNVNNNNNSGSSNTNHGQSSSICIFCIICGGLTETTDTVPSET